MKRIAIIGAGGFARELAWLIEDISARAAGPTDNAYEVAGFLVSDLNRLGPRDSPVLGDFSWLASNKVDALALGIGTPAVRIRLAQELKARFPEIPWPSFVHPSVLGQWRTIQLAEGATICAGSIATVNIRFAPFCLLGTGCTIGHESSIGFGSVLNPTATISGGVEVGSGVLIGAGALVLQYLKVGDGATIGAGAVVTKAVGAGTTVVGVPARELVRNPQAAGRSAA